MNISGPLTASDVSGVARLHRVAFPGFFLSALGEPFLRQFYRGHLEDPSAVTVVLRDREGQPAGCVVGTVEPRGFYSRLLRRRWLGFGVAGVRAALFRPRAVPRLVRAVAYRGDVPDGGDGALLSSICLSPHMQGEGAGSRLLCEWEAAAAARGSDRAYLTTDAMDNDAVNNFYARHGWRHCDSYVTGQGRKMNRYVKDLEPR